MPWYRTPSSVPIHNHLTQAIRARSVLDSTTAWSISTRTFVSWAVKAKNTPPHSSSFLVLRMRDPFFTMKAEPAHQSFCITRHFSKNNSFRAAKCVQRNASSVQFGQEPGILRGAASELLINNCKPSRLISGRILLRVRTGMDCWRLWNTFVFFDSYNS